MPRLVLALLIATLAAGSPTASAGGPAADYVVTIADTILVTDAAGNGDVLVVSEPGAGTIRFAATGRSFSVDGGAPLAGHSGDLPLAGIARVVVRAGAGADVVELGAFGALPTLVLDGGAGDDAVRFTGDVALSPGASLDLDLLDDDALPAADRVSLDANANVRASGAGSITLRCGRNVSLAPGSSLETVDGDLIVEANRQPAPTTGAFSGVLVAGGTIRCTGTNALVLRGRGGDDESGSQFGVAVTSAGVVSGGTLGAATIDGVGGGSTGAQNAGVAVLGASSIVTSSGAELAVTGRGGGTGSLGGNYGVMVESGGRISAGGAGRVRVNGTGGGASGISNFGVIVHLGSATITSGGGDVDITGHGGGTGASGFNDGVIVQATGRIGAGGAGSVTVVGTGGATTGNLNRGVNVNNTGSSIGSSGGDVTIVGRGGGAGGSGNNYGVFVRNAGLISAGSGGDVSIDGTGGVSAGAPSYGVLVNTDGTIGSEGGDVNITGVEGMGAGGFAIDVGLGTISTATHGGAIVLAGNSMNFDATATIAASPAGTVTLRPRAAGVAVALGAGADPIGGPLGLADAELDRVSAGTLVIGDSAAGTVTLAAPITRGAATAIVLSSGGDIRFDAGSLDTGGGALRLAPGAAGAVFPQSAGVDATTGAAALSFTPGSGLAIAIDGTTADTQYRRLAVAGTVDLGGAELALSGAHVPAFGDSFVIVDNDGADPVAGTFAGLPEGATITGFLGSGLSGTVTYSGGSGNDVVLRVPDDPLPVLLRRFEAASVGDGIELRWQLDGAGDVAESWIERAPSASGPWARIDADVVRDHDVSMSTDRAVARGETYVYRLIASLVDGGRATFGPIEATAGAAAEFALARVWPNPAPGTIRIEYALAREARVRLDIADLQGRVVARVVDGPRRAGRHLALWDAGGLPAGVYFVRLRAGDRAATRRVALAP